MNFNLITAFIVVSAFGFVTADIFETNKAAAFNKQACETSCLSICISGGNDFDSCIRLANPDLAEIPKDSCANPDTVNACRAKCTCHCTRCEACKKLGKTCN